MKHQQQQIAHMVIIEYCKQAQLHFQNSIDILTKNQNK